MRRVTGRSIAVLGIAVLTSTMFLRPAGAAPDPEAVTPPTPDTSVVNVHVGGDRTGLGVTDVAPLAGVTLELFASETDTTPLADDWASCVSDADRDCDFVIPVTGADSGNLGARFWVGQVGVPSGWNANPTLRTGPGSGSGSVASPYRFETPALAANQSYDSSTDFMASTSSSLLTSSLGIWQQSRANPPLPAECGVDVALVLDLSASVGSQLPNLKAAADTFTDSLSGTPSRMSLFSFSADSPSTGTQNHPEPRSVATDADAEAFKQLYASWPLGAGTNWDQALWRVAEAAPVYAAVVVITDGNPTRYSGDPVAGDGSRTHFRDVEAGIFASNAVKAEGTPVLAVGVGSGVAGETALNLAALSGPEKYDGTNPVTADYYQENNYEDAAAALKQLVDRQCAGTLSVIKQLVPPGNTGDDVSGSVNAGAGWQFTGTSPDPDVGGLPSSQVTTDDGTGSVNFPLSFTGTATDADVTVTETQHPGYTLVTPNGDPAVCVNLVDDTPVPVTPSGATGFTVDVASGTPVSCTVYNRAVLAADVTVDKVWIVDGVEHPDADRPDGLSATATLTGPGGAAATPQPWGQTRPGYVQGQEITVDEAVTVADDTCRLTDATIRAEGSDTGSALPFTTALTVEHNRFEVRNTVECGALLTLVKRVDNSAGGDAGPSDWRLTATGPDTVSGVSGTEAVTSARVAAGDYRLSETAGPDGYRPGRWSCTDETGALTLTGTTVTLDRGRHVDCVVVNVAVGSTAGILPVTGGHPAIAVTVAAAGLVLLSAGAVTLIRRRRA